MLFAIPLKLRTKLFLSFALATTALWSGLVLWSYQTIYKTVQGEAEQVMLGALDQDVRALNAGLDQVESISNLLCNNADVQRYFLRSFNTADEEYEQSARMLRSTDSLLRGMARSVRLTLIGYHPELSEIVPFDFENRFSLHGFSDPGPAAQGQVDIAVYRAGRFAEDAWPDLAGDGRAHWLQTRQDRKGGAVSLVQGLTGSHFSPSAGAVKLTLRLDQLLPGAPEGESDAQTFVLAEGALLDSSRETASKWRAVSQRLPELDDPRPAPLLRSGELVACSARAANGWQVTRVYQVEAMGRLDQVRFQFVTVLLLSLLTTFGLSYFIAHRFTARIHMIGSTVSRFAQGELNVRVPYQGDEDLDELALGYNRMAERIQSLIRDVYQTQILQQQQRLAMLQSQIRPHFLYNSLSAIVRLSERGDTAQIKAMATALVRFYRISLSRGREQIPLRDEVAHVRAYLTVCSIRYRDCFTCELDILPEAEGCFVPKIILQPFVENALEHGMISERVLHLRIAAAVHAGALCITVADDGVGMSAAALEAIERGGGASSGYGIHNVRERLRLAFGPGWGVHMRSAQPHGLCVTLSMPTQYKAPAED